ncbi:MAG: toxin-antitoxin system, antitoxin component [Deltaproteobacteria bacterium]|nr:toxin-antitoxin system, antitoxin component [Deltaproteobacteria bacterium]
MPQVSLYIDKETLIKVEQLAQKSHTSISKWVGTKLKRLIKDEYPDDFFELFGAIQDPSFKRPEDQSFDADIKRLNL